MDNGAEMMLINLRTHSLRPRISNRLAPAVQGIELGYMSTSTSMVTGLDLLTIRAARVLDSIILGLRK
jgi:hypothetical protein